MFVATWQAMCRAVTPYHRKGYTDDVNYRRHATRTQEGGCLSYVGGKELKPMYSVRAP